MAAEGGCVRLQPGLHELGLELPVAVGLWRELWSGLGGGPRTLETR